MVKCVQRIITLTVNTAGQAGWTVASERGLALDRGLDTRCSVDTWVVDTQSLSCTTWPIIATVCKMFSSTCIISRY